MNFRLTRLIHFSTTKGPLGVSECCAVVACALICFLCAQPARAADWMAQQDTQDAIAAIQKKVQVQDEAAQALSRRVDSLERELSLMRAGKTGEAPASSASKADVAKFSRAAVDAICRHDFASTPFTDCQKHLDSLAKGVSEVASK